MSAKKSILDKLRAARVPFQDLSPVEERAHMVPMTQATPAELIERFKAEAQKLACEVYEPASHSDAVEAVLEILGDDTQAMMWDAEYLPVNGLADALAAKGVSAAPLRDDSARVGITGVDAALAATGSLVVISGPGKSRQASLLPIVHVAIVQRRRILPDLETFYSQLKESSPQIFQERSNIAVISGPSKSADIAAELIHGMHGPGEVHIILVD